MIRAIDNKPLDLSDDEFAYYMQIVEAFGESIFQDTFETDDDPVSAQYGWITLVKPPFNKSLPLGAVFLLFNIQHNQRSRKLDEMIMQFQNMIKHRE